MFVIIQIYETEIEIETLKMCFRCFDHNKSVYVGAGNRVATFLKLKEKVINDLIIIEWSKK